MTSPAVAALLAAAVLAAPPPPRRRLGSGRAAPGSRRPVTVAILLVALSAALLGPPVAACAVVPAVVTGWMRRRRTVRRRRRRIEGAAVASALEVTVGELRAGAHPVHAFTAAAAESGAAVAEAFRPAAARARLGADVAAALRAAGHGSAAAGHWERIAVCWQLGVEHGLPMSGLMRAAHRDITDRQGFSDRVDASLAGARATAATLAGLPLLGVLLGQLVGAHPLRFLFGGGAGSWLLVIGTSLAGIGVVWSDRIIDGLAK